MRTFLASLCLLFSLTFSPVPTFSACYEVDCPSGPRTYIAPDPFQKDRDTQAALAYQQRERDRNDPSRLYNPSAQFEPGRYDAPSSESGKSPAFTPNRDHSQESPSWCSTQGYGNGCR